MPKSIKADSTGVTVSLDSKKGSVTGKVVKNGNGYDVILQEIGYPLSPEQKQSIRNKLRDWYFYKFAGQHDQWL